MLIKGSNNKKEKRKRKKKKKKIDQLNEEIDLLQESQNEDENQG